MYNVLLVDDERMIIEGISRVMKWETYGCALAGTARNGVEALEFLLEHRPDIVITDIRMPGLDGIELIAKAREQELDLPFIVLSGFGEFEYARGAMQYGVKHYLLKPSGEETIGRALAEVVAELELRRNKEQFVARMETEYKKMLPHAKEQLLKEFVMNKAYGRNDWDRYRGLFEDGIERERVRLALFQPEGPCEFEHLFALRNIAEDVLGRGTLLLGTTIGERVLLLVREGTATDMLASDIETIKSIFGRFYRMDATIALSEPGALADARAMYRETLECLDHRFYLGEGSLITKRDIAAGADEARETPRRGDIVELDEERLALLIKSGRVEDAAAFLGDFFDRLTALRLDAELAKSYAITLFLAAVRQDAARLGEHLERLAALGAGMTLQALKETAESTVRAIAQRNYEANTRKHSSIVRKLLDIIDARLGDPALTLSGVAGELLFMNPDYVGKLFKKETGEKFSNYLMKKRMERAIEWIQASDDVKVFELAERLGFGDNPQYFAKVFKKYTGFTPTEFKKAP